MDRRRNSKSYLTLIQNIIGGGGTHGARAQLAEKMLLLTRLKSTAACSGP
jgi:hypothetical protein